MAYIYVPLVAELQLLQIMILKKLKCLVRLASLFQIHLGWNLWSEIYAVQLPLQKLKLGGFWLYIVRNLAGKSEPPPPILSPPPVSVSTNKTVEAPKSNGTVSTPSLAITRPLSSSGRIESFLDKAADEGLVILQSPKVGFFMRSRTIKVKHAPPSCKEKQIVKEGKVLCYIEQLGCEIPIASDVSGEVIKILREDGDSIGYGDAFIAILPSFPGIKKLQ